MQDVYKNIEEYNSGGKFTVLIVFDYMIAVMISNKKKINQLVIELFIGERFLLLLSCSLISKYQTMLG